MFINHSSKQVTAKIVYYGPGLSGKTTNLQYIFSVTNPTTRGELVSIETEIDRTLFFDLLPINVGLVNGYQTKFQLYTVPGQIFYDATRKLVLKGADGIVFVVDSQELREQASLESFENLKTNLASYNVDITQIPLVLQFNKRDLENVSPLERLNKLFSVVNAPSYEAIATKGVGVIETLREISSLTLKKVKSLISQTVNGMGSTQEINFDTDKLKQIIKKEDLPFKKVSLDNMDNFDNITNPEKNEELQAFEELPLVDIDSRREYDTLIEVDAMPFGDLSDNSPSEEPETILTLEKDEILRVEEKLSDNPLPKQEPETVKEEPVPFNDYSNEILEDSGEVLTLEETAAVDDDFIELERPIPRFDEQRAQDTIREEELPFKSLPEEDLDVNIEEAEHFVELESNEAIPPMEPAPAPPFEQPQEFLDNSQSDLDVFNLKTDPEIEPVKPQVEKETPFKLPDLDIEEMLDLKKDYKKPAPKSSPKPELDETKVFELFDNLVDNTRVTVLKKLFLKNPNLWVEIKDPESNILESFQVKIDPQVKKVTIILDVDK